MSGIDIAIFNTGLETKEDENALVQLGAAVVFLWAELPAPLRSELLKEVGHISGVPLQADAAERISRLIAKHSADRN